MAFVGIVSVDGLLKMNLSAGSLTSETCQLESASHSACVGNMIDMGDVELRR
jgi:hypothetical protein